jgi:hypothetical protein
LDKSIFIVEQRSWARYSTERNVLMQRKEDGTCVVVAARSRRECENERDGGCGW